MRIPGLILITVLVITTKISTAMIIIPRDYDNIQEGVNNAEDGDTVLVEPGTYVENINYGGRNIVLISRFLLTGDIAYIDSTIIDGNRSGSVVRLDSGESDVAALIGFTIRNGSGSIDAENDISDGGVHLHDATPRLLYLKVIDNTAWYAAGIYYELGADSYTSHCLISGNTASIAGGGFDAYQADPTLVNCTITGNEALRGGGIYLYDNCSADLTNCIVWDNHPQEILFSHSGAPNSLVVSFSCINGGLDGINTRNNGEVTWDAGNMLLNPMFADLENRDYHLLETSPCIDAGDPESELDADDTWADMGALVSLHERLETPRLSIPADTVWFNPTEAGEETAVAFYVRNIGYDTLTVAQISMGGEDSAAFRMDFRDSTRILPGAACEFILSFSPDSAGAHNAVMTVFSDDPQRGELTITLRGSCLHRGDRRSWFVPGDFQHIQSAIDYCLEGDTVIVQPGIYYENIDFTGKNITVGSCFIFDHDPESIHGTVLVGDRSGGVVSFSNGETRRAVLSGMTITNGRDGIYCSSSSPTLRYCVITGNAAVNAGGGGINIRNNSSPYLENLTIAANSARWGGGIYGTEAVDITCVNSILWNNSPSEAYFASTGAANAFSIAYSDVEEGQQGVNTNNNCNLNWSNTNLAADPLFAASDSADYRLTWDNYPADDETKSPCIDTGDPRPPEDPDSTTSDIGALYFNQNIHPDITISHDVIEFINIARGETAVCTVRIGNSGILPLHIRQSIAIIEGPPFIFISSGGGEAVIEADSTHLTLISFAPWIAAGYRALYVIESNDPDEARLEIPVTGSVLAAPGVGAELPGRFCFTGIYPNPSNSVTFIGFFTPRPELISLKLIDLTGTEFALIPAETVTAGFHTKVVNAACFASGTYFAQLKYSGGSLTTKMLIIK